MVVDTPHFPAPGQTVLGNRFRMTPGGKGANQAVAAARAGGAVTFVTAVGDDLLANRAVNALPVNVSTSSHLVVKSGTPTGVALILVDAHGREYDHRRPRRQRTVATGRSGTDGHRILRRQTSHHATGDSAAQCAWAADYAHRLGCRVLLNPAPMPDKGLPDTLLKHVDILTPNEGELMALAPASANIEAAARAVLARGPQMMVVTQGKSGATVFTAEESFHVPAAQVTALDTVGAGDCFSATLGVALVEGRALPEAVRFAIAAAGLSTTAAGAQDAMPYRAAIDALLSEMVADAESAELRS